MTTRFTPRPKRLAEAILILTPAWVCAQDVTPGQTYAEEEVVVSGVRQRLLETGMLKNTIQKTEVISNINIERTQSSSLSEAIAEAPGVRVNNECSMCGVKRVMLNGLKGEHTNILVDGIPTYTMMSGFYGLDAAAAAGMERIEIARGAGASLIAPEAVGGTINIITDEAHENKLVADVAGGETGYQKASIVATGITDTEATRVTFIAQYDNRDQFDGDNNGVNENPKLENKSLTFRLSQDLGLQDNITVRANKTQSDIFGGPMGTNIDTVLAEYAASPNDSESLFVDGDVRNSFIGKSWEVTEWIASERTELSAAWLHEVNENVNFTLTTSFNKHTQDSFYEGFKYQADDDMSYFDARFNWAINSDHLLTFGVDQRNETLESQTNSTSPNYVSDAFNYDTHGLYLQDTWNTTENLEIAMALRYDILTADFTDPSKPATEIEASILSPRMDIRYTHNDAWTSRLSAGRGYRAPLSFFESDHGILDAGAGFIIEVDQLERSKSVTYALSYEGEKLNITWSTAYTSVNHLVSLSENDQGIPVLDQLEEKAYVFANDIALSYTPLESLTVSATAESFDYDKNFKQSYGVVPVEQRLGLSLDWDVSGWDIYLATRWINARDMTAYGVPDNPTFDADGKFKKSNHAPAYWTADFRVSKELSEQFKIYLGATNLFDKSQADDMESPLFYENGNLDVGHIYGPLRGRELYAGAQYNF